MSKSTAVLEEVRQNAPRVIQIADDKTVFDHVTIDLPTSPYPWDSETVDEFRERMITLAAMCLIAASPASATQAITNEELDTFSVSFLKIVAEELAESKKRWDGVHRNDPSKWFGVIVESLTAQGDRVENLAKSAMLAVEAVLALDAMRITNGRCFYEK